MTTRIDNILRQDRPTAWLRWVVSLLLLSILAALNVQPASASELDTVITPGEPFYARVRFPVALSGIDDKFEIATERAYQSKGLVKPTFLQRATIVRNQSDSHSLYITTRDAVNSDSFDLLLIGSIEDKAAFSHFRVRLDNGITRIDQISEYIPATAAQQLAAVQKAADPRPSNAAQTSAPGWDMASVSPINLNPTATPATLAPPVESSFAASAPTPAAAPAELTLPGIPNNERAALIAEVVQAMEQRQTQAQPQAIPMFDSSALTLLAQNSTAALNNELGHYKTVTVLLYILLAAGGLAILYVAIARVVERQTREQFEFSTKQSTTSPELSALNQQLSMLMAMNAGKNSAPSGSDNGGSSLRDAWMLEVAQNTRTLMDQLRSLEAQNAELARQATRRPATESAPRPKVRMNNVQMERPSGAAKGGKAQTPPPQPPSEAPKFAEKMQLATVYESMGDRNMARTLLREILADGTQAEKVKAKKLLAEMS